jgi:hypothetical protein
MNAYAKRNRNEDRFWIVLEAAGYRVTADVVLVNDARLVTVPGVVLPLRVERVVTCGSLEEIAGFAE